MHACVEAFIDLHDSWEIECLEGREVCLPYLYIPFRALRMLGNKPGAISNATRETLGHSSRNPENPKIAVDA